MTQLLNSIWTALTTENVELVNILLIPAGIAEAYILMSLFLIPFNVQANNKQKMTYITCMTFISILGLYVLSTPYNVIVNYGAMLVLISLIFKLDIFKSLVSLVVSLFIFILSNTILQKIYLILLGISFEAFNNTPIYRLPYLTFLYLFLFLACNIFNKIKKSNFNLSFFDNLDRQTLKIIYLNVFIGICVIIVHLVTSYLYIDIIPLSITIFNFALLVAFLSISIYSFSRIITLANTKRDLQNAEEYNRSLEILYDKVKGFKHDSENIVSTIDGFIDNDDMDGLKVYFKGVKTDYNITKNLSVLNPRTINNPGIYSLLNNKYFTATNLGITFDIHYFLDLSEFNINLYEFSRILGVLLDNAIEEAEKCDEKTIHVNFIKSHVQNKAIITVENTYTNKDVDLNKIFEKGYSSKENHYGIGLWEVNKYISKTKNMTLTPSKTDKFFKQTLIIA